VAWAVAVMVVASADDRSAL